MYHYAVSIKSGMKRVTITEFILPITTLLLENALAKSKLSEPHASEMWWYWGCNGVQLPLEEVLETRSPSHKLARTATSEL